MPRPFRRTVRPVWAPSGTLTGILQLPSQFSPPIRQGASISPPSAATAIGTGTVHSRSRPSRSKSSCGFTEMKM